MAPPCNCDTFTGNVTIDGSLGIGATTPAGALDVSGSGATVVAYVGPTSDDFGTVVLRGGSSDTPANGFLLQAVNGSSTTPVLLASLTGQVGIGTATPAYPLDVAGEIHTSGALRADGPLYAVAAPGSGDAVFLGNDSKLVDINVANTAGLYGQQDGTVGSLKLGSGGGTLSGASGNIGIGKTNPAQPLDVQGTISATGLLLGGDILLYGALKDSTGTRTNVDAGGCYYAS